MKLIWGGGDSTSEVLNTQLIAILKYLYRYASYYNNTSIRAVKKIRFFAIFLVLCFSYRILFSLPTYYFAVLAVSVTYFIFPCFSCCWLLIYFLKFFYFVFIFFIHCIVSKRNT